MDIEEVLLLWFINFLIKSPLHLQINLYQGLVLLIIIIIIIIKLQLSKELHKPIIRKFKKRKVYSGFRDNIWGADLAGMQLINNFNKGFRFLLCVIDIFSKYAWVVPLKDKNDISINNGFQKILDKSERKPNKIWVDKFF